MPAMRNFTVVQTREVQVTAHSMLGAIEIANAAFINGQNSDNGVIDGPTGVWGNTTSAVKITDMNISLNDY